MAPPHRPNATQGQHYIMLRKLPIKRPQGGYVILNHLILCCVISNLNLTRRQSSKLEGLQLTMLQKMVTLKSLPEEIDNCFMSRFSSKSQHIRTLHNVNTWDRRDCKIMLKWAGDVTRMSNYCENRFTHRELQHKSWNWIRWVPSVNFGNQLHGRKLQV